MHARLGDQLDLLQQDCIFGSELRPIVDRGAIVAQDRTRSLSAHRIMRSDIADQLALSDRLLFVDATFFRQRHRAEVQLARNAAALPLAPSTSAVAHFLVREPVRAMSLASAALFRRGRDGVYAREESVGWDTGNLSRLDAEDEPLLMLAQAENAPLTLYDHPWRAEGVPSGPAHPVLALPIIVRHELTAIVFYGSHIHGEALDPDEIKAIAGLAPGAATAYDHLESESAKREVDSLKSKVELLQAQLAEAQIQPA